MYTHTLSFCANSKVVDPKLRKHLHYTLWQTTATAMWSWRLSRVPHCVLATSRPFSIMPALRDTRGFKWYGKAKGCNNVVNAKLQGKALPCKIKERRKATYRWSYLLPASDAQAWEPDLVMSRGARTYWRSQKRKEWARVRECCHLKQVLPNDSHGGRAG